MISVQPPNGTLGYGVVAIGQTYLSGVDLNVNGGPGITSTAIPGVVDGTQYVVVSHSELGSVLGIVLEGDTYLDMTFTRLGGTVTNNGTGFATCRAVTDVTGFRADTCPT